MRGRSSFANHMSTSSSVGICECSHLTENAGSPLKSTPARKVAAFNVGTAAATQWVDIGAE